MTKGPRRSSRQQAGRGGKHGAASGRGAKARTDHREVVLSLHGVASEKQWQKDVRPIFDPTFRYHPLSYPEYDDRRTGAIKAVVDVRLLLLAVLSAVALAIVRAGYYSYLFSLLMLFTAALLAARNRRRCARSVESDISGAAAGAVGVHMIAHSFGTYHVGRALKGASVRMSQLVLIGCVLPRRFPWSRVLRNREDAFRHVRNEVGKKDAVVWLAGLTRVLNWELGASGLRGFKGDSALVHNIEYQDDVCTKCDDLNGSASVHNVSLMRGAHSDYFLTRAHALELWFPWCLRIWPNEYRKWLASCGTAAELLKGGRRDEFNIAMRNLARSEWQWTKRANARNLEDLLRKYLAEQYRLVNPGVGPSEDYLDEAFARALRKVVNNVHSARTRVFLPEGGSARGRVALSPWGALRDVVEIEIPVQ